LTLREARSIYHVAHHQRLVRQGLGAAQHGLDARHQLGQPEGLVT
jgi:hypothetical protein